MNCSSIVYELNGRVATITLNRPDRLNAIDERMPEEIARAVEAANANKQVHVIVLTGAGRAFCAGYDLREYAERPTAMWVYRVGAERAKRMLLTGDLVSAAEAAAMGLVSKRTAPCACTQMTRGRWVCLPARTPCASQHGAESRS